MTARDRDAIRVAIIDGIHAQFDILQSGDERPQGQPFAIWLPGQQGAVVGINAPIDIGQIAKLISERLGYAEPADDSMDDEWERFLAESALPADEPANAPQSDETPETGTDTPPSDPERSERPLTCKHCGTGIERHNAPAGLGWRHTETMYSACGFNSPERAEP